MAKSTDNVVMQGAFGKTGRTLVFRQKGDQTIIARKARLRTDGKPYTKEQMAVQDKFIDASLYAKKAIKDEELKARYKVKANINQTAYNRAFKRVLYTTRNTPTERCGVHRAAPTRNHVPRQDYTPSDPEQLRDCRR